MIYIKIITLMIFSVLQSHAKDIQKPPFTFGDLQVVPPNNNYPIVTEIMTGSGEIVTFGGVKGAKNYDQVKVYLGLEAGVWSFKSSVNYSKESISLSIMYDFPKAEYGLIQVTISDSDMETVYCIFVEVFGEDVKKRVKDWNEVIIKCMKGAKRTEHIFRDDDDPEPDKQK